VTDYRSRPPSQHPSLISLRLLPERWTQAAVNSTSNATRLRAFTTSRRHLKIGNVTLMGLDQPLPYRSTCHTDLQGSSMYCLSWKGFTGGCHPPSVGDHQWGCRSFEIPNVQAVVPNIYHHCIIMTGQPQRREAAESLSTNIPPCSQAPRGRRCAYIQGSMDDLEC
jgi:hypothetical protein